MKYVYIDASYYRGGITGLSRFSDELIDELLKLSEDKKIILFSFKGQNINIENININISVSMFTYINLFFPYLARLILKYYFKKPGIIHYHDSIRFPGDLKNFKSIVTIHDIASLVFPETYPWRARLLKKKGLLRLAKSRANIVAVSKSTKSDLEKFDCSFKNRINVIGEGVSDKFLTEKINQTINEEITPYFLVVGSPHRRKNFKKIHEAFILFTEKQKIDYHLVFAGKNVQKYFENSGIHNFKNIHFKDGVSDLELINLYSNALAYLNFSIHEGFGLTILEAMARKCLVVGSNTTAVAENISKNGITASPYEVVEIEKSLQEVASMTKKQRQNLIELAYLDLKFKKWDYIAKLYIELFK